MTVIVGLMAVVRVVRSSAAAGNMVLERLVVT
jgi:DNA-directed RNA polymerase subunit H (RpoH/RPB5)